MEFRILNWNIGGAKYLDLHEQDRLEFMQDLNYELGQLIRTYRPHVITLQEIVRYGPSKNKADDIIDKFHGYRYYPFPLIDTDDMSARRKWDNVRKKGQWDKIIKEQWQSNYYFAQGNAFLFNEDIPPYPVWSLSEGKDGSDPNKHFVEQVTLQFGLYFGNRDTEPRAALVSHFILRSGELDDMPLDVFVVNLHLTTLKGEREGIPQKDEEAIKIRLTQLKSIFYGIVSQYNTWIKEECAKEYNIKEESEKACNRHPPIWILAGDFNFTPESLEYETIIRRNFIDVNKFGKGTGTKAKGRKNPATLTLDYIFAGPKFISFDPIITEESIKRNPIPFYEVEISDHYPIFAKIPLSIKAIKTYKAKG
ncbi:MAG: endonuclease/exonuclease/phosphatase family protein [Desulfobaccales bacterium]